MNAREEMDVSARKEMEALASAHGFLAAAGLHDEAAQVAAAIEAVREPGQ